MPTTTWQYQLGDSLSGARVASGNVLLDWVRLGFGANDVANWYMDEADGTSLVDQTDNELDLTLSGAYSRQAGWTGANCLRLTGTNGLASRTDTFPSTTSWTLEYWSRWTIVSTDSSIRTNIIMHNQFLRAKLDLRERISGAFRRMYYSDGTQTWCSVDPGGATFKDGEWHLYTITYDRDDGTYGTFRLYRNGNLTRTAALHTQHSRADCNHFGLQGPADATDAYDYSGFVFADGVQRSGNFSADAIRYPDTGDWQVAAGRAATGAIPGLLTVRLSAALPSGTSLRCKLVSVLGADTGWQTLSGSDTTYVCDFSGLAVGDWRPAVQLLAGGTLNANTPEVVEAALDWEPFGVIGIPPLGLFAMPRGRL